MEKIKLLIADDEKNVRLSISRMIQWEKEGIEVCGLAQNGQEALDLIEKRNADIAIVDIRMPNLTGLEVAAKLKERNSRTKIIILSGYDDFVYAQQALKHGVVNYMLKPSRPDEILKAVKEVCLKIFAERQLEIDSRNMEMELDKSRYELKNKLLADLILSSNANIQQEYSRKLGYCIEGLSFCIVIKPFDNKLMYLDQQQFIIDYIENGLQGFAGAIAGHIAVLLKENTEIVKSRLREELVKLKNLVYSKFGISICVGVGNVVEHLHEIQSSYQSAMKALGMHHFLGPDFVIFYDSIYSSKRDQYPVDLELELLEAIRKQNKEECCNKVDLFFSKTMNNNMVKNAIALLLSLYHYAFNSGLDADSMFGQPLELIDNIQRSSNKEEIVSKMKQQCCIIIKQLDESVTENRFINAAILYIKQNYHREITLSLVAEQIHITSGYLSTLFKQVVGETFTNYLNRYRIERACELLKDVKLRTYEVAYHVGYQDDKYFIRAFKKITGQSPSQYRSTHM